MYIRTNHFHGCGFGNVERVYRGELSPYEQTSGAYGYPREDEAWYLTDLKDLHFFIVRTHGFDKPAELIKNFDNIFDMYKEFCKLRDKERSLKAIVDFHPYDKSKTYDKYFAEVNCLNEY